MKSKSLVFTQLQKPLTVFNVPFKLLILLIGFSFMLFAVLMAMQLPALGFMSLVLSLIVGYITLYRLNRKDHHFFTVWQTSRTFWKQDKSIRILIRGVRQ